MILAMTHLKNGNDGRPSTIHGERFPGPGRRFVAASPNRRVLADCTASGTLAKRLNLGREYTPPHDTQGVPAKEEGRTAYKVEVATSQTRPIEPAGRPPKP